MTSKVPTCAVGLVLTCGHPFAACDDDAPKEAITHPESYEWECFVCEVHRSVRRVVGTMALGPDDEAFPECLLSNIFDGDDDDTVKWDGVMAALGIFFADDPAR